VGTGTGHFFIIFHHSLLFFIIVSSFSIVFHSLNGRIWSPGAITDLIDAAPAGTIDSALLA